jgi:hypothetical protein
MTIHFDVIVDVVPWLSRSGRQHGHAVMLRHLEICPVEIRLVTASSIYRSARVIRNDKNRAAGEELERPHMAINPAVQILPTSGLGKGITAGA